MIKSLFSSSEADEEPISRDNPVSCSKKYNIEVSLTRHRDPKPLFFLCVLKIAIVRARVYVCVFASLRLFPVCQNNYINEYLSYVYLIARHNHGVRPCTECLGSYVLSLLLSKCDFFQEMRGCRYVLYI